MFMACLDMFNADGQSLCGPTSPRISFSNDFANADHMIKHERATPSAPGPSDFEFSVTDYSMIAADDIFFKGRLLPLKNNCTGQLQKMTLRDELLHGDGWEGDVSTSQRPPKGPTRWKELLGLKKAHASGKKQEKSDGSLELRMAGTRNLVAEEMVGHVSKEGQEFEFNGSARSGNVEI